MSWSGARGMPGPPGLDKVDYEIIVLALGKHASDPTLPIAEAKEALVTGHLVEVLISWREMKAKLDALDKKQ